MPEPNYVIFSHYGMVSVEFQGERSLQRLGDQERALPVKVYRYLWWPPQEVRRRLPKGFHLEFECLVGSDGHRRFQPVGGVEFFVRHSFHLGLQILRELKCLSRNHHHTYCAMFLLYQFVQKSHAHLGREFRSQSDLYVRRSARGGEIEGTVLPDDLGMLADGTGKKWSIGRLIREGEEEARRDGIVRPTTQQKISYGLLAAARLNPLRQLNKPRTRALVRCAMFDLPAGKKPKKHRRELLRERILVAINRHLDDSAEQFNRIFAGGGSNFLKTVGDQPGQPGGRRERDEVRRVYLDLCWYAYAYMADSLQAVAGWFDRALGDLTPQERKIYEQIYRRQRYFGGLPLLLLFERKSCIKLALMEIWENPTDREAISVLHKLLAYYFEMATKRRAADRRFKSNRAGGAPKTVVDADTSAIDPGSPPDEQSQLGLICEFIREKRNLAACCGCGIVYCNVLEQLGDEITIHCACGCGRVNDEMTVTAAEMKSAGRALDLYQ